MEENFKSFVITWHIENFRLNPAYFLQSHIPGPSFTIAAFGNSKWNLKLYQTFTETRGVKNFSCMLRCIDVRTTHNDMIGYFVFNISNAKERTFKRYIHPSSFVSTNELSQNELSNLSLPNDTLVISCSIRCESSKPFERPHEAEMDRECIPIAYPRHLHELRVKTVIEIETRKVSWPIKEFTSLSFDERLVLPVHSAVEGEHSFDVTLYRLDSDLVFAIEITKKSCKTALVGCVVSVFASTLSTGSVKDASNGSVLATTLSTGSVKDASNGSVLATTLSTGSVKDANNASVLATTEYQESTLANDEITESVISKTLSTVSIADTVHSNGSALATTSSNTSTSYAYVLPAKRSAAYKKEHFFYFPGNREEIWLFPTFLNAAQMAKDKYFEKTGGTLHLQLTFTIPVEELRPPSEIHRTQVLHPSIPRIVFTSEPICTDVECSYVVLRVGDRDIKAPKCLLMGNSDVFEAMFSSPMTERETGVVQVEDLDPDALELMVDFLQFKCGLEGVPVERLIPLYRAAHRYQMHSLMSPCPSLLANGLALSNVCGVLELAHEYEHDWLLETAIDFVFGNAERVLLSSEWVALMETSTSLAASIMHRLLLRK